MAGISAYGCLVVCLMSLTATALVLIVPDREPSGETQESRLRVITGGKR